MRQMSFVDGMVRRDPQGQLLHGAVLDEGPEKARIAHTAGAQRDVALVGPGLHHVDGHKGSRRGQNDERHMECIHDASISRGVDVLITEVLVTLYHVSAV
jgi:hypothetical protein